jgi:chloramphenicol-sensitive protein RarD
VVLRERLRAPQWVALGIAGGGVLVMAVGLGTIPWIALGLAVSFGLYGLTKKQVGARVTAVSGLAVETGVMLLPAAGYLIWLTVTGGGTFGADVGVGGRLGHALLLASAGVVSAVPLVLFAAGARRLSLASVAMTQFVTPVMQFVVGVVVLSEPMPASRWIGFGLVWLAVLVLLTDLSRLRRTPRGTRR